MPAIQQDSAFNKPEAKRVTRHLCPRRLERGWFVAQGTNALPIEKFVYDSNGRSYEFGIPRCPLHEVADLILDCGSYEGSTAHCPHFEGEGFHYNYIGCSCDGTAK